MKLYRNFSFRWTSDAAVHPKATEALSGEQCRWPLFSFFLLPVYRSCFFVLHVPFVYIALHYILYRESFNDRTDGLPEINVGSSDAPEARKAKIKRSFFGRMCSWLLCFNGVNNDSFIAAAVRLLFITG